MFETLLCWAFFLGGGWSLFSKGLIIGEKFAFQNALAFTTKTPNSNNPLAYFREGLLSEGYLRLRLWGGGGGIFGTAYFWERLLSEFYGMPRNVIWHYQ